MIRGSSAAVMRPNVAALFTVVLGLLKLTVLNRLKTSARNWKLVLLEKVKRLNTPRSTVVRFGPKNSPLSVVPNVPLGLTANAAGLNQTVWSAPAGGSSGWPVGTPRLSPRPQPALSTPLVMVYG